MTFITYDSYPNFAFAMEGATLRAPCATAKHHLTLQNAKRLKPLRHHGAATAPGGWNTRLLQPAPKPGQLRLWTFQSIAHGADFVSYLPLAYLHIRHRNVLARIIEL